VGTSIGSKTILQITAITLPVTSEAGIFIFTLKYRSLDQRHTKDPIFDHFFMLLVDFTSIHSKIPDSTRLAASQNEQHSMYLEVTEK